jgi:hypothetical protein
MKKLHFQVTSMDKRGYILRFHNYDWDKVDKMLEHVNFEATDAKVNKIEIVRWNEKGERE